MVVAGADGGRRKAVLRFSTWLSASDCDLLPQSASSCVISGKGFPLSCIYDDVSLAPLGISEKGQKKAYSEVK